VTVWRAYFQAARDDLQRRERLEHRLDVAVDAHLREHLAHAKFCTKYKLAFPLLSDPEGKTIEKYGAWGEKNMYGKKSMGIVRTTVVIDEKGVVRKVFAKVRVNGHVEAVLETLASL